MLPTCSHETGTYSYLENCFSSVCISLFCFYRWRGFACWQWCLWPHWWRHTPILRGLPCWGRRTVSCRWGGCCAYSCSASPPWWKHRTMTGSWFEKEKKRKNKLSKYCTFLQVIVGISGSPEAAHGITSSRPASWRYSPPGLTLK